MKIGQSRRFGKVRSPVSWFAWAGVAFLFVSAFVLMFSADATWVGRGIGLALLVAGLLVLGGDFLRVPVVTTDEEGVALRQRTSSARRFVKWEDVREVVIWYQDKGGPRVTMIGVRTRPDFEYDNYGRYPAITPNEGFRSLAPAPPHVGEVVQKWSVNAGGTKAGAVAQLINAAEKDVAVTEVEYLTERVKDLTVKP